METGHDPNSAMAGSVYEDEIVAIQSVKSWTPQPSETVVQTESGEGGETLWDIQQRGNLEKETA